MSGGIRPADWIPVVADEVEALKTLSGQLGKPVILRMTGFSHDLADDAAPIEVTATYPNEAELAEPIHAMPKVDGGTDFGLVFQRINSDVSRSDRDNVIVSDLEWVASPQLVNCEHPEHLNYVAVPSTHDTAKARFISLLEQSNLTETHTVS